MALQSPLNFILRHLGLGKKLSLYRSFETLHGRCKRLASRGLDLQTEMMGRGFFYWSRGRAMWLEEEEEG